MRHVTVLSRRWFPLTLQRTKFLQIRGWREKFSFHITHGHGFAFCPEKVARYFQKALYYTTDIFLPFFKYRRRKNVPAFEKRGHHDLRILRFERIASTVAVRTRGDFGIIPSPYDIDAERKMRSKSAAKVYERSMRESLACKLFLELESFATRCEVLLPYDRERCIIRTIFVAGGRTEMAISYNKL